MPDASINVRMGELAVTNGPDDVLVTIGLGSCIGLTIIDRSGAVAGLAHVVLPDATGVDDGSPGKFADRAVPALVEALAARGASRHRLEAVLVGGASMFSFGDGKLDVGRRNEEATRAALAAHRIPVIGAATAGNKGRTVRVRPRVPSVTSREAGAAEIELL